MHARKKKFNGVIALLFALMIFLSTFCANGFSIARAKDYPFDQTNVLDDLEQSEEFSLALYPWDSTGLVRSPGIINFVEWCFSPFQKGDFAMYVYFYNPQNLNIDIDNPGNKVQMAIDYDKDVITSEAVPTDYEGFNLIYCNKSERPNYEGLFYKFRILDHVSKVDGKTIEDRLYTGERRYDISGITLVQENGAIQEYAVGGTYIFQGYAEGYGPNEFNASTLECTSFRALETISLEVHPTYYRTDTSIKGNGYQNDINSVYFSIPNKYLADGSSLQKIKAEWHEYETQPMLVVNGDVGYQEMLKARGESTRNTVGEKIYSFSSYTDFGFSQFYRKHYITNSEYVATGYSFNIGQEVETDKNITLLDRLDWVFQNKDLNSEILVSRDEIKEYAETYDIRSFDDYLPVSKKISAKLFKEDLSEERRAVPYVGDDVHYKRVELDANDKFNVFNINELSGWNKFLEYGFWAPSEESIKNVSPIEYETIPTYIDKDATILSDLLLIAEQDVNDFKEFYNVSALEKKTTVLFRFAQTDYFSTEVEVHKTRPKVSSSSESCRGVISFQTFFYDFKIIHLTFMDENETYKVIPVTQDPIDIYKDITKKPNYTPDWLLRIEKIWQEFLQKVGAIGTLLLGIVGAIVIIVIGGFIIKATSKISGPVGVIISVILAVGLIVGIVFYGIWIFNVIAGMGGLL